MEIKNEKVVISRRTRNSIDEIYNYVKNKSKSIETAHYVRKSILDKCLSLKDFSGYSKEIFLEEHPEDYRSVIVFGHM